MKLMTNKIIPATTIEPTNDQSMLNISIKFYQQTNFPAKTLALPHSTTVTL